VLVLLPAVLRDWRGFFVFRPRGVIAVTESIAVFIDFQNVHLVGHGLHQIGAVCKTVTIRIELDSAEPKHRCYRRRFVYSL
jgi:hypothetical protein